MLDSFAFFISEYNVSDNGDEIYSALYKTKNTFFTTGPNYIDLIFVFAWFCLFNLVLKGSIFPSFKKLVYIRPVFKEDSATDIKSYRSIFILCKKN